MIAAPQPAAYWYIIITIGFRCVENGVRL
uniref:Uncharacterized protein n=1 Tax=Rhizophora mucronata TaxID=61149 RepID=A0A2P2JMP3_RHIMU